MRISNKLSIELFAASNSTIVGQAMMTYTDDNDIEHREVLLTTCSDNSSHKFVIEEENFDVATFIKAMHIKTYLAYSQAKMEFEQVTGTVEYLKEMQKKLVAQSGVN